ncbi:DNA cytosine methyltransferase [Paracoccus pantotrophus]|uniref:DNA (cytosine-5-)-methyltransferase n=1 Tax=Paracoccus pantotrophus TaxID=82367 RepID=A0A7H9BXG8_PARPN|nr:DNA cytosine methyltransferase [Paracoccus pantotrophus]QLH16120.1 DNA cytosine methyltransferase [Paracoccus pantotrophus]
MMRALDLFSAAAGGWSLGLHRAGFITIAACEIIEWRRILYAENNPHVRLYEDIRDLTAARLVSDLGTLPNIIVGSPPCQDISSANTKGKGIEGERSGLYLEAIRLVSECRPRWFAFENSANLRTRGADRLLGELDVLDYTCWPCVVGAADIGANHVRKRSWLIGCDPGQLADTRLAIPAGWHPSGGRIGGAAGDEGIGPLRSVPQPPLADADGLGRDKGRRGRWSGVDISAANDPRDATEDGCGSGWTGRCAEPVAGAQQPPCGHDADAGEAEWRPQAERAGDRDRQASERREGADRHAEPAASCGGNPPHPDEARQPHGPLEPGLRPPEIAVDGRGDGQSDGWRNDGPGDGQMGRSAGAGGDAAEPWADWNGGLADHLRLDDGLSAWLARTRIALGSRKGTSAASLIVEAFGDAVLPQIPEAIGRAILRTEAALNVVMGGTSPGDLAAGVRHSDNADSVDAGAGGHAAAGDPEDHGGAS